MQVKKIVWAIHVGWPIHGMDGEKWSPEKISAFVTARVLPKLVREANEEGAIIVLVKTPSLEKLREYYEDVMVERRMGVKEAKEAARREITPEKQKQIEQIESMFTQALMNKLPFREKERFVLLKECADAGEATMKLTEALKSRNFTLKRKLKQVGTGAYRRLCVTQFPRVFRMVKEIKGTLRVPKRSTIGTRR